MSLVITYTADQLSLKNLVNYSSAPENLILKLFQSNTTPTKSDATGAYTEATFTGYSSVTLTGSAWNVSANPVTYAVQTFTSSMGGQSQLIYGYYLVGATSNLLYGAERFSDGPYTIANLNDNIQVAMSLGAN